MQWRKQCFADAFTGEMKQEPFPLRFWVQGWRECHIMSLFSVSLFVKATLDICSKENLTLISILHSWAHKERKGNRVSRSGCKRMKFYTIYRWGLVAEEQVLDHLLSTAILSLSKALHCSLLPFKGSLLILSPLHYCIFYRGLKKKSKTSSKGSVVGKCL